MTEGVNYKTDPDRPHHGTTGIYVRAIGTDGQWGNYDIAELDRESLDSWLRSRDSIDWPINVVMILLGWHGLPVTTIYDDIRDADSPREAVFLSLGAASMCWDPRPREQVFDGGEAERIGQALLNWLTAHDDRLRQKVEAEMSEGHIDEMFEAHIDAVNQMQNAENEPSDG